MCDKKKILLLTVDDTVSNLLYYDRKEDEELSRDDVKGLLESGEVTMDEIVETFKKGLHQVVYDNFNIPQKGGS